MSKCQTILEKKGNGFLADITRALVILSALRRGPRQRREPAEVCQPGFMSQPTCVAAAPRERTPSALLSTLSDLDHALKRAFKRQDSANGFAGEPCPRPSASATVFGTVTGVHKLSACSWPKVSILSVELD